MLSFDDYLQEMLNLSTGSGRTTGDITVARQAAMSKLLRQKILALEYMVNQSSAPHELKQAFLNWRIQFDNYNKQQEQSGRGSITIPRHLPGEFKP